MTIPPDRFWRGSGFALGWGMTSEVEHSGARRVELANVPQHFGVARRRSYAMVGVAACLVVAAIPIGLAIARHSVEPLGPDALPDRRDEAPALGTASADGAQNSPGIAAPTAPSTPIGSSAPSGPSTVESAVTRTSRSAAQGSKAQPFPNQPLVGAAPVRDVSKKTRTGEALAPNGANDANFAPNVGNAATPGSSPNPALPNNGSSSNPALPNNGSSSGSSSNPALPNNNGAGTDSSSSPGLP